MANKINRLEKLEERAKPPANIVVIWEDVNEPGAFYTKPRPEDGKRLTEQDIQAMREDPEIILIMVRYDEKTLTPIIE